MTAHPQTFLFIRLFDLSVLEQDTGLKEKDEWIQKLFSERKGAQEGETLKILNVDIFSLSDPREDFDQFDDKVYEFIWQGEFHDAFFFGMEFQTYFQTKSGSRREAICRSELNQLRANQQIPVFVAKFDEGGVFTGYEILEEEWIDSAADPEVDEIRPRIGSPSAEGLSETFCLALELKSDGVDWSEIGFELALDGIYRMIEELSVYS